MLASCSRQQQLALVVPAGSDRLIAFQEVTGVDVGDA
jgi:hypothetical protein